MKNNQVTITEERYRRMMMAELNYIALGHFIELGMTTNQALAGDRVVAESVEYSIDEDALTEHMKVYKQFIKENY